MIATSVGIGLLVLGIPAHDKSYELNLRPFISFIFFGHIYNLVYACAPFVGISFAEGLSVEEFFFKGSNSQRACKENAG